VTITQLDPIAVSFSLPQRNLGDALATLRAGGGKVTAVLPDNGGTLVGKLSSSTTPSTRHRGRSAPRPSSPTRTSGSGRGVRHRAASPCRRSPAPA
jgi:hypothetical protein